MARTQHVQAPSQARAGNAGPRPAAQPAPPDPQTTVRGLGNDYLRQVAPSAGWTALLSQPDEPDERAARARAAAVLADGWSEPKAAPSGAFLPVGAPASVNAQASGGRALALAETAHFAPRFGTDLGHVRVHDDAASAVLAESAQARAFTVGSHIFFNRNEYRPGSPSGHALLAHELAHVEQAHAAPRLWRQPKDDTDPADADPKQAFERVHVFTTGVDNGAKVLAAEFVRRQAKGDRIFIGLGKTAASVYDSTGTLVERLTFKADIGVTFLPGIYIWVNGKLSALMESPAHPGRWVPEPGGSRAWVVAPKKGAASAPATDPKGAKASKDAKDAVDAKLAADKMLFLENMVTDPSKLTAFISPAPGRLAVVFVPSTPSGSGEGSGESPSLYASPIQTRGDGTPANAPPWPVTVDGPKLVPVDSDPTFSAKVDWSANGNFSVASQVITQVGESIHYRWERFDITSYARKQLAKDPANTAKDPAAKPEKTLDERIAEFTRSQAGTGTDVTGTGGARREFRREFEDWWKDTKRAKKGAYHPGGDTIGEQLSNAAANRIALELSPVSFLVTAVGATLRLLADLFAGPRQQQEVPLEKEGIYLIRVITTPAIHEDRDGKPIVRPPSVYGKVVEVTPMDRAVRESLDEPSAQLAELKAQIALAEKEGNQAKAAYLRDLLAGATERFEGTPLAVLTKKRDEKFKELTEFKKKFPTLSDYSRQREVDMLDDQIGRYKTHAATPGLTGLKRVNATLISEVTGEQYPLLISAGPMAKADDGREQWLLSDVTNRDGDPYIGLGAKPSDALRSALEKFAGKAAYGRGRIGIRTAGLGLETGAPSEMLVDSAPADWALAEKRIDDLVTTLALLGLVVASAGTAAAVIGAGVAAARLIHRWQAGRLYLDSQTVSDVLGVLGGIGAAGQLAAGLRVQKFEKVFAVVQEGGATEAQIGRAAEALRGAGKLAQIVEVANEAINYGGLLWGNVAFIDQMLSISEQERTGGLTHAAARRARAGAISSAVQNNGLFIAGNVLKARQNQKAIEARAKEATAKEAATREAEAAKTKPRETPEETVPGETKPVTPEPVPIGERQATVEELRGSLPTDLRDTLVHDKTVEGDTAQAEFKVDKDTGLITEIKLRCGPDTRPETVRLHTETLRTMQKYQGFSGRVRQALSWVAELIGVQTLNPANEPLFRAQLEIRKLPRLIEAQMNRMRAMEPNARNLAEAELASLQLQLEQHVRALEIGGVSDGAGVVASKGVPRAKQRRYAELLDKLRPLEAGSKEHKAIRWEMYELIGGDLPYGTWEKIYDANAERANKANEVVAAEHKRLGWGKPEQTVPVGRDEVRRLDIADVKAKEGIEIKKYETGVIYASEDIVYEVDRDAKLVKAGWKIKWVLIDTDPSGPLLQKLLAAGITVEYRQTKGDTTVYVRQNRPSRAGAGSTR